MKKTTNPSDYQRQIAAAVAQAATQVGGDCADNPLERPRDESHGDYSSPIALHLARVLKKNPMTIAQDVVGALNLPAGVLPPQIAPPGFINFTIAPAAKLGVISEILASEAAGEEYGRQPRQKQQILLEFVSANPTGPLHVGHGRACAYGDALANLLEAAGIDVQREYYVNDAGRQMDILAASAWLHYWRKHDAATASAHPAMPNGAYQGDYLAAAAQRITALPHTAAPDAALPAALAAAQDADAAADTLVAACQAACADRFAAIRQRIGDILLDDIIKPDMQALGVAVENISFFKETTLHDNQLVAAAIDQLEKRGALYQKDGAQWFRASAYGDEKDRVVRRANGALTYFAADIAYHAHKLSRPRPPEHAYGLINVLGADHHGYVPRIAAAMCALGYDAAALQTQLIQFVALFEDGKRLKMSTRAGEFVTLGDLIQNIGTDDNGVFCPQRGRNAARFYYLSRKNDQHLDFDLAAARAQERKNPVFYLSYAHARINSIMANWRDNFGGDPAALAAASPALLADDPAAVRACALLMQYPALIVRAAQERAPHLLAAYLHDLAAQLQSFYETSRILPTAKAKAENPAEADNEPLRRARLALLQAAKTVLANGARLLGIDLPESM